MQGTWFQIGANSINGSFFDFRRTLPAVSPEIRLNRFLANTSDLCYF